VSITKLVTRRVEKPWGRRDLAPHFPDVPPHGEAVGEVWFEDPRGGDPELLVKYLFTSERLSVQVHPGDVAARARGYARGKEEAWLVLAVAPGATVGLGTVRPLSADELRAASLDGSIEHLLDWKLVRAGEFIYSPAGTVHAIGAGVTLIEVQQNVDLTYRLYDYGRPRELHLDEGIAVSDARPFRVEDRRRAIGNGRTVLCEGRKFVVERVQASERLRLRPEGKPIWVVVVDGLAGDAQSGEVLLVEGDADLPAAAGSDLLLAYTGAAVLPTLVG
jgi:mannose-6-phosphate isomerase